MSTAITNLTVHMPWWAYLLLAFLVLLIAIYIFASEIVNQIFEQLIGLAKGFFDVLVAIAKFFFQFMETLWQIWGLVFALRWRFQYGVRYFFSTTTLGVLLVGTFYLCAELGVAIVSGFKHELPDWYAHLSTWLCTAFPALYIRISAFQMLRLHEMPFKMEALLFVLAVFMFRHHLMEFFASRRREEIPPALEEVFLEFDKFRDDPVPDRKAKNDFLETLMKKLKDVLDKKNKRDVAFALFEEEQIWDGHTMKGTGILKISFLPANSPLDRALEIPVGKGGAGKAFADNVAIYIPSVRHRIGIDLDHEKSVGLTYFAPQGTPKYKAWSILSVPILVNPNEKAIAVIAVSSRKRRTFWDADFEIVRLAASIISTL